MKLYTSKTYSRLYYYLAPVGLVTSVAIPLYLGKELTHVLLSNTFLYIVIGLGFYTTHKQSRLPVFEIAKGSLIVNNASSGKKEIPLDSILGIRRNMVFGHSLLTLSGEISIPLRWLNRQDREIFLSALDLKI